MNTSKTTYIVETIDGKGTGDKTEINDILLDQFLNLILYTTHKYNHNLKITFPISDKIEVDRWYNKNEQLKGNIKINYD